MLALVNLKNRAIALRRKGLTYNEILGEVKVAKSTLSTWLRSVSLAKPQAQRITAKKLLAQKKATDAVRAKRILTISNFLKAGIADIAKVSKRDLFILGIGLYWAEGAKQREGHNVSQGVDFTNSDLSVIRIFLKWLELCCRVARASRVRFEIYIHESVGEEGARKAVVWWRNGLGLPSRTKIAVRFKRHKLSTRRHLREYNGQFRVKVTRSTNLNRQIAGWVQAIVNNNFFVESSKGRT